MRKALLSLAAAAACIFTGGVLFTVTQHVSLLTGIYWAVATGSTVGYGDVTAHGTGGRLISIGVMLTAIPLLANAFSHVHVHRIRKHVDAHVDKRLDEHDGAIHARLDEIEKGAR